jgi:hypothetical protein
MNSNGSYRINTPTVVHETIDGETIILNLDNGNYYSLDGVGADIWGLIESGVTVSHIVESIGDSYQGACMNIEGAINELVSELLKEKLIVPDKSNGSGKSGGSYTQAKTVSGGQGSDFQAPLLNKYSDMQDLLLLDPIHEVDEGGWPTAKSPSEE